ncbi:MAG TPA: response regulator [candidate division Zixibacteria bacterium]|nr:response regulator [candidate division Zixibacteria bacterium]
MSGPAKILVADDELVVVSLVQECLSDQGHEVVTASCGAEAEAQLQRQSFDLLITDIRMPDFDGIELLRRAKALHPSIGAIFMTGYANVESAKDAIKEGALDYLMKPFEIVEIRTAVANALKKLVDQQVNSAEIELDRVSTMASLMNAVDDLDSLIRMSLGFALLQCDLSRGAAVYWSPSSQELLTLSTDTGDLSQATLVKTPMDTDPLAEISHNPDDNGAVRCETYSEHPLGKVLSDPRVRARLKPPWLADDGRLVSFPISRGNSVFGYLLIGAPNDEIDSHQKEFKFLRLTAQQTALSIENLRLLEEARDAYRRLQDLQEKTIEMETAAARGEFAAEIGHELKNFLGVVYGNISLLELQIQKGQA